MANKVVVITGASSGIGEATAKLLASKGAIVALAARRLDKLQRVAAEILAKGGRVSVHEVDVTNQDQVNRLIGDVVSQQGRLDVMVNNAGLMAIAPLTLRKTDEWDRMIDINIKGLLYGVAAALPVFEKQQSGHFVNIASVVGLKVFSPGGTVYSGTKFAVRAISEGLRHEAGGNIRTTVISPGAIDTELKFGSGHDDSRNFVVDFYKMAIPADAIAQAIAYAIEQPSSVDVNEIVIRPTVQDF
ncbi:SDR family oxidoreductase [Caballeronia novacaledonica]|uniref:SDR family oxidoreductase n=1 Tax=Caballeronia novacaledonica TaxID=1544861 RepID=A0AA37IFM6_9BURK|nr:SDR family oxidoreductase [Caballeronia novacaledonica]GJH13272.1 SDR family oxidoreductase [Caballeronia novacaledonica]GJH28971.1 SDR family oxidoreductase [Caballeronia novacaledonica]